MTYHVVCHDCPFEAVKQKLALSIQSTVRHREATGHNVEYKEVIA